MQNFIKTIINAVQNWTKKEIKTRTNKIQNDLTDAIDTLDNLDTKKMSKSNPVGTGSFSMNRMPDSEIGYFSHAEGNGTTASGYSSHAEGSITIASGDYSHAEGSNTQASNHCSHAEGSETVASGFDSHAEGSKTTASGNYSHAEGSSTIASGDSSHAEGSSTIASGLDSHAEGGSTTASGDYSHAEGGSTIAQRSYQHVQGKCNIADTVDSDPFGGGKYAHIVGNGTSEAARSNAHTLDWNGVGWFQGGLQVGGNAQDDGAKNVLLDGDAIPVPSTAQVGQTIVVSEVDENGKPTKWEAVDAGGGDTKFELLATHTISEADADTARLEWNDSTYPILQNAKGFIVAATKPADATGNKWIGFYINGIQVGSVSSGMGTTAKTMYTTWVQKNGDRVASSDATHSNTSINKALNIPTVSVNWNGEVASPIWPEQVASISIGSYGSDFAPIGTTFSIYVEVEA